MTTDIQRKQDYEAYLRSSEWQERRRKVLKRDGHLCQGCLERPACEVHHITYRNIRHEFCFELISLCTGCHRRLHGI